MLLSVFSTEFVKYKRSLIPWLVLVGGFFPAMVAVLFLVTGDAPAGWDMLMARGVEFFNMLALLLTAVIAGNAFVMEYHQNGVSRMHLYPVPRWLQYGVKLAVPALFAFVMHLLFLLFLFGFGLLIATDALTMDAAAGWIRLTLLVAAGNILWMPMAALVGILCRNAGAYILAGIGSFVLYMSFAGSAAARWVPPCVPAEILGGYLVSGRLVQPETGTMFLAAAAVSALLIALGGIVYARMER